MNSSNTENRIMVSRNRPLALVVGAAGFIGSHVVDRLLSQQIQVVGIDDFSTGIRDNLTEASKDRDFHLLNQSINEGIFSESNFDFYKLPRLDYAFFIADSNDPTPIYTRGLTNFLNYVKKLKDAHHLTDEDRKAKVSEKVSSTPKIVFVSKIDLYDSQSSRGLRELKEAEVRFAKFVKYYKLNARIVRLAPVYGPRMHFRVSDPMHHMLATSLKDQLPKENTSSEFSTRALYIDDAVSLILKSVLVGSTSQKIYDGCLLSPIKVAEIRQILLDPVWHEMKNFSPTELPPWTTPNLDRTVKELNWKPKTSLITGLKHTLAFLKEKGVIAKEIEEEKIASDDTNQSPQHGKKWSFANMTDEEQRVQQGSDESLTKASRGVKFKIFAVLVIALVVYGLIYPVVSLGVGFFSIRENLKQSREALIAGDFETAEGKIQNIKYTLEEVSHIIDALAIIQRVGIMSVQIDQAERILKMTQEGVDGVQHAVVGSKNLFKAAKHISGEGQETDINKLYSEAQIELETSSQKLEKVSLFLADDQVSSRLPEFLKFRVHDLSLKLDEYAMLTDKARTASFLIPQLTAVSGQKSYLILFQNNFEIRSTGGYISNVGLINFEQGRLKNIKIQPTTELDKNLVETITPPELLAKDLNMQKWDLQNSNFEPDFPTSSRQAEFFYKRESGVAVNGVFGLDLYSIQYLLKAAGGVDLTEYGEQVSAENLFEKVLEHSQSQSAAEQASNQKYLSSLYTNLLNKVFYLSKQNWPEMVQQINTSLDEKHTQIYLADPTLFAYILSENWGGAIPRGALTEGETRDFLFPVDTNVGGNLANYFVKRDYLLNTTIDDKNIISHTLRINYHNTSSGKEIYKNRFRAYLPLNAKIKKVTFGETDITSQLTNFSDYGRAGISAFLQLNPQEQKTLAIEYSLTAPLGFAEKSAKYRMDILKQAGTDKDNFSWEIKLADHLKLEKGKEGDSQTDLSIVTQLVTDKSIILQFISNL